MTGLKTERYPIVIKIVRYPAQRRTSIWGHPRYQAWLRRSYEDARRTVERLSSQSLP